MAELTKYGLTVRPAQYIARNDFVSGWQQPSRNGLAQALDKVASWDTARRHQLLRRHLPVLRRRYSQKAVRDGWTDVCHDMEQKLQTDGAYHGLSKKRNTALRLGTIHKKVHREVAESSGRVQELEQKSKTAIQAYKTACIHRDTLRALLRFASA